MKATVPKPCMIQKYFLLVGKTNTAEKLLPGNRKKYINNCKVLIQNCSLIPKQQKNLKNLLIPELHNSVTKNSVTVGTNL